MAYSPAPALRLRDVDDSELRSWVRAMSCRASLVRRARIVLLASEGVANTRIAQQVDVSLPTVLQWRERYARYGLKGLFDAERSGRPRRHSHTDIVTATLTPPPKRYGVTH